MKCILLLGRLSETGVCQTHGLGWAARRDTCPAASWWHLSSSRSQPQEIARNGGGGEKGWGLGGSRTVGGGRKEAAFPVAGVTAPPSLAALTAAGKKR